MLASAGKARQLLRAYRDDRLARAAIHGVLAANLLLIAVHTAMTFILRFGFHPETLFVPDLLITTEGGYPEMFNYIQLGVLSLLLLLVFVRTRQPIYASAAVIFVIALGHDALELHERTGGFAELINLPAPPSLGAKHFGELLHFMAMGALSIVALLFGFTASGTEDRKIGGIFVFWIFALGFFAAAIDAAHVILHGRFFGSEFILGVVEDGGEMLTVALGLSTALLLFRRLDDLRRFSQ